MANNIESAQKAHRGMTYSWALAQLTGNKKEQRRIENFYNRSKKMSSGGKGG